MIDPAARFRRKERVTGREIAGESFLIPICGKPVDLDNIFVLNPLAGFIWERLDGEHALAAIVAAIVENFEVSSEQAGADAAEFIGQLLQNDLAEEVK
jgi:hypothetical protein